jgi:predicted transcriptional regulator
MKGLRRAEMRSSRVAHLLRVVVASVGEWISEREPRRVMRW